MVESETARQQRELQAAGLDARTRLFAIVGDPIEHVRAPVVWTQLFRRYGINALFLPAQTSAQQAATAFEGLKAVGNLDGMMITMPYKQLAMQHVDQITERARRIGCINIMRRNVDGSWLGDNIDGAGFVLGLKTDGVKLQGAHAYVHGAGGVGQSIAWMLAMEPLASLTLFDIDTQRAETLAGAIRRELPVSVVVAKSVGESDLSRFDVLVNATPVGLHDGDPLPFAVDALRAGATVADVIMEPMYTRLLRTARERGLQVHHGRNMMNYAMPLAAEIFGLPSQHEWNGGAIQNDPVAD